MAVDRFGDVAVVHVGSLPQLERWRAPLEDALGDFGGVYVKVHARAANRLAPPEQDRRAPAQPIWGTPVDDVGVIEQGVQYVVRPAAGLSPGLFLDMREVRAWVRGSAGGRSVLNLFAYTCAFGLNAALGGAARVVNLDLSRRYLDWGQDNYRLNGLATDPRDFIFGDAFDWLGRVSRRHTRFDLVVIDPPSFSSTPFAVGRDYPRLVDAAARVVSGAGILVAATNHAGTSDARFEGWLRAGLESAGRQARLVHGWHEPEADFPVAPGGRPYLKVRALRLD